MSELNDSSPSVQTHLQILQGVIQRMANNSSQCKAWCITLVSAILIIIADKGKPDLAWVTMIPSILFFALDSYYLALEKGFREAYSEFIKKLHDDSLNVKDMFEVKPRGKTSSHFFEAMKSFSVWGVYSGLVILIAVTRIIILS
ncbi:MAG: hypothetical protein R8G66_01195 [Cytophagales bacterium]|nr:hypothetical protein [Cytophagales bacterium]